LSTRAIAAEIHDPQLLSGRALHCAIFDRRMTTLGRCC
jgi:hypothetical protein